MSRTVGVFDAARPSVLVGEKAPNAPAISFQTPARKGFSRQGMVPRTLCLLSGPLAVSIGVAATLLMLSLEAQQHRQPVTPGKGAGRSGMDATLIWPNVTVAGLFVLTYLLFDPNDARKSDRPETDQLSGGSVWRQVVGSSW